MMRNAVGWRLIHWLKPKASSLSPQHSVLSSQHSALTTQHSLLSTDMWSGPVSRIPCPPRERGAAAIPLGGALRRRSSNLPGCLVRSEDRTSRRAAASSLFGLAPDGVFQANASPRRRCALTAPFHPCLIPPRPEGRRRAIGGVFSVALSVGSPRLAVSKHPALWCSDFPPPAPPRPRPEGHGKRQQGRQSRPW